MREELEEIKRKLGEAQRQIIEQQHGDAELELAVQILEKSLTDLDGRVEKLYNLDVDSLVRGELGNP